MSDPRIVLHGIRNCDQVKKARAWLDTNGFTYRFHDFKKLGADATRIAEWQDKLGWEALLNRRGTTWRGLPDALKAEATNAASAAALMSTYPSLIKRPVLCSGEQCIAGFSEIDYQKFLKV
jgi:arsenate reductase